MMSETLLINTDRVELNWPDKNAAVRVFQTKEGKWDKESLPHKAALRGIKQLEFFPGSVPEEASIVLGGQRHDALSMLSRSLGPVFRFIYLDLPRLNVDDVTSAFQSVSSLRLTTWLSVVRSFLIEARELLSRNGVVAVHCGEEESQYARILLDELFRDKRVATIMWQKAYSAQHMKGMKTFTDTHDLIYAYARDKDALSAVGLRRPPKDYANTDEDPRGAWKAEHKGAKTRRENSDFSTFQPPYRWKITEGKLPPGLWRLSPFTGVIWGEAKATGLFNFTAEVTDRSGANATKKFSIKVIENGADSPDYDIPWIFAESCPKGKLRIVTSQLADAALGKTYSAILFADGGAPYKGKEIRPGSGRYWEFAIDTLKKAFRQDAVYQGSRKPTAIPTPKKYEPPNGVEIECQQSIWLGRAKGADEEASEVFAGFTEDATKHLKALKSLGYIESEISTAKPERLMERLLNVFTDKGDLVLEVLSSTADLTAVAIKSGRRAIALQGFSDRDRSITTGCAIPRLQAVLRGQDQKLELSLPGARLSKSVYIPHPGGGSFATAEVGSTIAVLLADDDHASLTDNIDKMSASELAEAILTAEGYLPPKNNLEVAVAISGREKALMIPPTQYLTPEIISSIASQAKADVDARPINIYYFKATDDIDEKTIDGKVSLRRIPFDLLRLDLV